MHRNRNHTPARAIAIAVTHDRIATTAFGWYVAFLAATAFATLAFAPAAFL
jgi:hypothetical protein